MAIEDRLRVELEQAELECQRLHAVLEEVNRGWHLAGCDLWAGDECTCGLTELLRSTAPVGNIADRQAALTIPADAAITVIGLNLQAHQEDDDGFAGDDDGFEGGDYLRTCDHRNLEPGPLPSGLPVRCADCGETVGDGS